MAPGMGRGLGSAALAATGVIGIVVALGACSSETIVRSTPPPEEDAAAPPDAGPTETDAADAAPPRDPTPADIRFSARAALPAGELLVVNDWRGDPNALYAMKPDGTARTAIFGASRVWSFGVSRDRKKIAFACEDPFAEARYGIKISDAIQHTWVYDVTTQQVSLLSKGNINDECHAFGPGDKDLWVCRRYDFTTEGRFKGWRLGKTELASGAFAFVTPEETSTVYRLDANVTPDGAELVSTRLEVSGGATQKYTIERRVLATGAVSTVRQDAGRVRLSPDGKSIVYTDYADARKLYVAPLDGLTPPVKILDKAGSDPAFSPDGARVAVLVDDRAENCSHVEIVKTDGSEAAAPVRVHDCARAKDFITSLAWIAP